ncbi:unnamed protein product [Didymodactylos carnosus]|uniref:NAD(P)(+)--arginine ADP-ribosyltransferase n=1 Tax=Didymodactylos carnosus TaxID=1234261 RepID=A0A815UEM6_9BILA|nr:unnamed protein product [Didymodactylos carnosus]CAF1519706.1 unnamed protein product [Didymodactylos carnosus]CAF4276799.1 unnamed protein product [Didymodactylos carnosus]CAF4379251.1 unnamed protein product [Didymodactylos carnosus]
MKTVRETIKPFQIDTIGPEGNTALHAASIHGHAEIVRFLLRYHASKDIRNGNGLTAEEVATDKETIAVFKILVRPSSDSEHFSGSTLEIEWLDSYKNAYRISYENHEYMRRWLTKVPLRKLLDAVDNGYIGKMKYPSEELQKNIQEIMDVVKEDGNPLGLLQVYTHPGISIFSRINQDLAEVGSDFRFVSTQALINSGDLDNEAPKGLGQYIFASILINHRSFRRYYHKGDTYRGVNMTENDLEQYKIGNIIITRSFLSTSKNRDISERFLAYTNPKNLQVVMCICKVLNLRSSLYIREMSQIPDEEEVLIVPFTVFEVKDKREVELVREGINCRITEIDLEECQSNLV